MRWPSRWLAIWLAGALAVAVLAVVLMLTEGVGALPVAALLAALFGSAPAWWRWADEKGRATSSIGSDASSHPTIPETSCATETVGQPLNHSPRRLGTPEFRRLIAALGHAIPHEEDIDSIARRTMERPHLIRRGRGNAVVRWQAVIEQAYDDKQDLDVLDEAASISRDSALHAAIAAWRDPGG